MITSTGGGAGLGTGSRGASHHSRQSGANIAANSRLTAYSGRNSCQLAVPPASVDVNAYVQMMSATAQLIAQPARTLSQGHRGRARGTVVPRGRMNPVTVIRVTTMPPISRFI